MRKQLKIIAAIWLVLFAINGCATFHTQQEKYLASLHFFNDTVDRYLIYYRSADMEQRYKWKTDIHPYIIEGSAALDLWGLALAAGEPTAEKEQAYFVLKDKLLHMLIQYEIINVTGG